MPAAELRALIESAYRWALEIDFDADGAQATFWYRSQSRNPGSACAASTRAAKTDAAGHRPPGAAMPPAAGP